MPRSSKLKSPASSLAPPEDWSHELQALADPSCPTAVIEAALERVQSGLSNVASQFYGHTFFVPETEEESRVLRLILQHVNAPQSVFGEVTEGEAFRWLVANPGFPLALLTNPTLMHRLGHEERRELGRFVEDCHKVMRPLHVFADCVALVHQAGFHHPAVVLWQNALTHERATATLGALMTSAHEALVAARRSPSTDRVYRALGLNLGTPGMPISFKMIMRALIEAPDEKTLEGQLTLMAIGKRIAASLKPSAKATYRPLRDQMAAV